MTLWLWIAFLALIGTLVVLDLALFTRRPRVVTAFEALATTGLWLVTAVAFSFLIATVYESNWLALREQLSFPIDRLPLDGEDAWWQFLTGYALELALNLDNIAVLALLIAFFRIPRPLIARTLFWSILFCLVARLALIMGGAALLRSLPSFKWVLGGILVIAMFRMLLLPDEKTNFDARWYVRLIRRILPVSTRHNGQRLFTRIEKPTGGSRWAITPMCLVVVVAAMLDVSFAADSIPALFSVTKDPFLAFSASALAVLGLRSIYFTVATIVGRFRYLRVSLVFILLWVAAKMFLAEYTTAPTQVTMAVVAGAMGLGILGSLIRYRAAVSHDAAQAIRPTPLEDLSEAVETTRRNFRKVVILIVGTSVVLLGLIIAPLPGPGPTVLIPLGLGLLATEFLWAKRLMSQLKQQTAAFAQTTDKLAGRSSPWLIPPVLGLAVGGIMALAKYGPLPTMLVYAAGSGMLIPIGFWAWRTIRHSTIKDGASKVDPKNGGKGAHPDQTRVISPGIDDSSNLRRTGSDG